MIEKFAHWIIRQRYLVVLAVIGAVVAAGAGTPKLSLSNDYRMFFGEDNPQLLEFERMQNTFNKNDNILFVITPKDGEVFSVKTLKAVQAITEAAWQIPFSTRVDSITNYQHTYAEADDLIVSDLVDDVEALTADDLTRIERIALNEPMMVHRLISPDSRYTGVNVNVQIPGKSLSEVPEAVAHARAIKTEMLEKFPDIEIRLVGLAVMNNAFPEASQQDAMTLYPLALGFIIATLFFLLRGYSGALICFVMIIMSIIVAMGVSGWVGVMLSPPVLSAPIMILTMAIANGVHLLVSMRHEMALGMDKITSMVESIRINFQPVFVTSLTTILGFLSLNFSDAPPFHDLGNIAAIGVATAFVLSVTFLPAMVIIMPTHSRKEVIGKQALGDFGEFVIKHRRSLLIATTVGSLALATLVPKNELNDVFVEYFDQTVEFRRDSDYAAEHLTGVYYVDYALRASETGGISDPDFLKKADQFSEYLRSLPEVIHVHTITDTFKRLNKNMHGDDPAWYRLPDEREMAAQYLLLYEMSLPYGLDLNNQIDISKSATKIAVTLNTLSSNEILELEKNTQQWLQTNFPDIESSVSGPTIMFAHIGKRNINSMLIGTTVALILISAVLVFFMRSLKYGLISLIPNLLPAAVAFGIWSLFSGQVGLGLSVVTGMTLGIVVDDTVHFLSKYIRARREKNMDAEQAVRYAFNSVGIALLVTSVVLIAGFMILAQSHFVLNSEMGLLTSIIIALALVLDFTLLPPLLMKLDGDKK